MAKAYKYKIIPESEMEFGGPLEGAGIPGCHPGALEALGADGWELVAVTPARLYIFMKRER